jgi:two-component system, cell cycle sensor histidine kinase DivJ
VNFLNPLRDYLDALVHPSARHDPLAAARHRAFIGSRILFGLIAFATFPIYLVLNGAPAALDAFLFGWMLLPLANAYVLTRTGRYETAHILAAFTLALLALMVAAMTGGFHSFAIAALVVVPLEAVLTANRRIIAAAAGIAAGAVAILAGLHAAGWIAPHAAGSHQILPAAAVTIGVVLYAVLIAMESEALTSANITRLSAKDSHYQLLASNMTDVITRHGRNGAVNFISPVAETVFGVRCRDLFGHGLFERVHVGDRPAYLKALSDAASGARPQSVEFRARCDGENALHGPRFVWIEMRCRALDPAVGGDVVAVMRDVSERRAQQETIEKARSDAERANASKGHFLATMSHELRTPLNSIIGFSDMLINGADLNIDDTQRREYAQLINDSGHHLLSVVNEILDMSKIETGNFELTPEPFALEPLIVHCAELLALKAREAGLTLALRLGTLPDIVADKRAVKQIVLNLISNAVKFTDRGGHVTVTGRADPKTLTLTVEDTGIGIAEADLKRVGDPFFQARTSYSRPYDGTGLGLSIVKGLVALHGGSIDIRSRLGEGTCVTVQLPIDCERPGAKVQTLTIAERKDNASEQVRKRA